MLQTAVGKGVNDIILKSLPEGGEKSFITRFTEDKRQPKIDPGPPGAAPNTLLIHCPHPPCRGGESVSQGWVLNDSSKVGS